MKTAIRILKGADVRQMVSEKRRPKMRGDIEFEFETQLSFELCKDLGLASTDKEYEKFEDKEADVTANFSPGEEQNFDNHGSGSGKEILEIKWVRLDILKMRIPEIARCPYPRGA